MCNCSVCSNLRKWKQREDEMLAVLVGFVDHRNKKPDLPPGYEWDTTTGKPVRATSTIEQDYADAVRKLNEVRKERDKALSENETFRNKLASSESMFRRVNTENADLRKNLAQQNLEFGNLMAAYKALLDSQKHLIGALE